MGGRKSLAALPIGQTACDVLLGCESRGDRRKYTSVLLAVADYSLFGREPGRLSGVDNDLWSALKGEVDRIQGEKKAKTEAGKGGGRPQSPGKVSIGKHKEASESIGKHQKADEGIPEASGTDKIREDKIRKEDSPLPPSSGGVISQAEDKEFEDLWDAYPRKTGKFEAKKSYLHAIREHGVRQAELLNAVMAQSASAEWTEEGGRFVPALSRWLDEGRWHDVLSPPEGPNPQKKEAAAPAPAADPLGTVSVFETPEEREARWRRELERERAAAAAAPQEEGSPHE